MGLCAAAAVLLVLELVARWVLGVPPDPPGLWQRWDNRRASFELQHDQVVARFQDRSEASRFPTSPDPALPRVLFMGGSSMHGGSRIDTELELPAVTADVMARRGRAIEAINLGNPGLDSHDIRQLATEALAFGPDALVIYTGHNDLGNTLQEQRYGSTGSALVVRLRMALWRSRAYLLLRDLVSPAPEGATARPGPRPDAERGTISPGQRLLAAEALQRNLEAIGQAAQADGVGLVLVTPISNWTTCRPIGRGCPEAATLFDVDQWGSRPVPGHAHPQLAAALEAYPGCAELHHAMARVRHATGDPGAAEDFRQAIEHDPMPMRATIAMTDAVRAAAASTGASLVDLEAHMLQTHGIPSSEWFLDCLHFSPHGHAQLAELVSTAVEAEL